MRDFSRAYSQGAFKARLGAIAGLGELFDAARKLYALMRDPETPLWVKGMCAAALGYLILPTDAVTDLVPVLGYSDDLTVLAAALVAIASRWGADGAAGVSGDV